MLDAFTPRKRVRPHRQVIPGVGLRCVVRLPGPYSGIYEVIYDGDPCRWRIRRQSGAAEWMVETEAGFHPEPDLVAAVATVIEEEVRLVREASSRVREFVTLLETA